MEGGGWGLEGTHEDEPFGEQAGVLGDEERADGVHGGRRAGAEWS